MAASEEQYAPPPPKKQPSEDDKRRKKLVPGGLLKAELRPGGGESKPSDGDQVMYHCTVRTLEGVVVHSTKKEFGGKGIPVRHILGKSKLILGLLEGIPTMLKGEVAMFKMKSGMHYGEENCPVPVPDNFPKDDELHFEIELIEFGKAKVVAQDFGVVKKVINDGEGWETPRAPYEVKAWISAQSGDGKQIFSNKDGEPILFTLGKSEVPKGLEMGIGTMTRGERAMVYVTREYLTQSSFFPDVEGFEEVHFDLELIHFVQVRDVLGDGRMIKRRLRDGRGEFPMNCPLQDSLLRVHYTGMLLDEKNTVFYDTRLDNDGQPLEFSSGEGSVPEGFEMCVRLMLPGEISLVTCPPDYAYDKFPRPPNVLEGAYIQWKIELLDFETAKATAEAAKQNAYSCFVGYSKSNKQAVVQSMQDWTGLDFKSIMEDAEKTRRVGNRLFKEGKYALAKAKYDKVLREFNHVHPQDDEEGKEFANARNLLHLNVAACYLKMGECKKSIETCEKVLETNPAHVKALYRRGMAYMEAGDFEEARNDFNTMIKSDKSCEPEATAALLKLKQKEQGAKEKAKRQFKGLFDKRPGEISEAGSQYREIGQEESEDGGGGSMDSDKEGEDERNEAPEPARPGFFSRIWPMGRRIFENLGLNRCTIL